jgi:hypothetical protein
MERPDDAADGRWEAELFDALDTVRETGEELPTQLARIAARYLSRLAPWSVDLAGFAETGVLKHEAVAVELSELWRTPQLSPLANELISRLCAYVIRDANDRESDAEQPDYTPFQQLCIDTFGPSFAAFLSLPEVPEDDAIFTYHESYLGMYQSLNALVEGVVESVGLRALFEEAEVADFASIDPVKVLHRARETWDIVQQDGRYYIFDR